MRGLARVYERDAARNNDDDWNVGVQVRTQSRGGDLGRGGGLGGESAICLRARGGDPASLFSLTGYSRVTARARPPSFGRREGCVNSVNAHVP